MVCSVLCVVIQVIQVIPIDFCSQSTIEPVVTSYNHFVCLRVICPAVHGAVCVLLSTLYLSQPYLYRTGFCTLLLLASYQPLLYVFVLLKNFYPTVLIVPLNALHWPAHLNLYLSLLWNQHSPAL